MFLTAPGMSATLSDLVGIIPGFGLVLYLSCTEYNFPVFPDPEPIIRENEAEFRSFSCVFTQGGVGLLEATFPR